MNLEIPCIIIIVLLFLINPTLLNYFSNNLIGRLFIVILIIAVSNIKIYLGVLLVLLLSFNEIEGMKSNNYDEENIQTEVEKFRQLNCKGNILYKNKKYNDVSIDQVEKLFPTVRFTNDKCNPCDKSCQFSISNSREQLSTDESLGRGAGVSSKQFRTGKLVSDNEPSAIPSLNRSAKYSTHAKTSIE